MISKYHKNINLKKIFFNLVTIMVDSTRFDKIRVIFYVLQHLRVEEKAWIVLNNRTNNNNNNKTHDFIYDYWIMLTITS